MSTPFGAIAAPGQTTGQRIGGIIGATIGAFTGGPAGAFMGYQIGAEVSGALDPVHEQQDQGAIPKQLGKGGEV
ncbi:hypothetical protein [Pseudomonas sp. PL-6]